MLSSYRRVLTVPGALRFTTSGLVGRLPISMTSLGIVLLVEARTGSYALAGAVASAYILANAGFAIGHGHLVDRLGQARVLPVVQLVFTGALASLVLAVEAGLPDLAMFGLAALAGAALPQVGACVRARWSWVLGDRRAVQTAFAIEAVVDEAIFVVGPVLVTLLATTWHPAAGLAAAGVLGLLGTLFLALQRDTQPPPRSRGPAATPRPRMPWGSVLALAVVCAAFGAIFGSLEVVSVAFADEQGAKAWAGPLLAMLAVGSLAAGVVSGAITWRSSVDARVGYGVLALGMAMLPLVVVKDLWTMAGLMVLAGVAVAPTLIATMAVVEREVPHSRLTEGLAIVHTGMAIGIAPGAALAGATVDAYGASIAYLVPIASALLGAAAWFGSSGGARARRPDALPSSP